MRGALRRHHPFERGNRIGINIAQAVQTQIFRTDYQSPFSFVRFMVLLNQTNLLEVSHDFDRFPCGNECPGFFYRLGERGSFLGGNYQKA